MGIGEVRQRQPAGVLFDHVTHAGAHLSDPGQIARHRVHLELVAERGEHRGRLRLEREELGLAPMLFGELPVALLERSQLAQEERAQALILVLDLAEAIEPHRRNPERSVDGRERVAHRRPHLFDVAELGAAHALELLENFRERGAGELSPALAHQTACPRVGQDGRNHRVQRRERHEELGQRDLELSIHHSRGDGD